MGLYTTDNHMVDSNIFGCLLKERSAAGMLSVAWSLSLRPLKGKVSAPHPQATKTHNA